MPKIVVEGPDGRRFAFPDTMPQSDINAFMRNKYGTKSRNETVDQYLARVVREQDATQARARDIDRRAAEAGRAEGERAAERMGVTNPLMMAVAAPAIGMAQQAGARPVYEREGTILPDEAAGLSAINAAGFFIPGMVNQRFGQRLEEGRRQEPVAAFAGDIAGGFPSGEVIGLGLQKAGQAIAPGIAALGRLFQGRQSISPEVQATLQQTAVGSIGGSAYGSQNDVNNDGVIDEKDAYAGALAGGLGLPAGIKGAQLAGDLMQVPRGAAEAIPAGSNPYLNRRSMRPEAPAGPGEATLALREEWRPLMPSIAQARATAEDAIRLAEQARTPQQIEQAKAALGTLRNQVSEMRAARGGAATPEDQRIDDILESLQPTNDPVFLGTQASAARQSLDRLGQSLGFEQAGPRGRQAIYDEALFDLRGDAPLGMNNEIKVVTEPVIAPDGTVLRKGVAEAVTGAELPISTGRAPPRTVLPRGADQPAEPRGPGRYAAGTDEIKPQGFGAGTPKTPTQPAERFFSGLQKAIPTLKPEKATAEQWKGMLNNAPGVKKEELEWTGVMDWLDAQQGPVSKADLDAYVRGNGVQVEEVVKGAGRSGRDPRLNELERQMLPLIEESDRILLRQRELATKADNQTITEAEKAERSRNVKRLQEVDDLLVPLRQEQYNLSSPSGADTKWSSFTLPGGENYSELLLTLPMSEASVPPGYKLFERDGRWILRYPDEMDVDFASRNEAIASISKKADSFRSSHWDEPNVLAHVRFKDRTGPNGERILAMEEIQSDWHQAGRKRGYANAEAKAAVDKATADGIAARASMIEALTNPSVIEKINTRGTSSEKEMLSMVQRGMHVSDQNLRGILINFFRDPSLPAGTGDKMNAAIKSYETSDAAYKAAQRAMQSGVPNAPFKNEAWTNLALNRMIRKAAEEGYDGISWIPGNVQNGSIVNAADNRGDFYDKIVVNAANKIGKKYGAKTERLDGVATTKEGEPVSLHYMRVTPELKRKALEEGFPLFAAAPFAAVGGAGLTSERELGNKMKRDKKD